MTRWDEWYFGAFGGLLLLVGGVALLLGITGGEFEVSFVTISGTFLAWRGIVVLSAGAFYLHAVANGLEDRRQQATVFMGSLMLWIVGGTDLLATLLGAVPGGPDVWIASAGDLAAAMLPPYSPAIVALPFSLVALAYTGWRPPSPGRGS
ncbi:MAG: hypothetical protein ACOC0F_01035 [archaeon]